MHIATTNLILVQYLGRYYWKWSP